MDVIGWLVVDDGESHSVAAFGGGKKAIGLRSEWRGDSGGD
jgi:hypothetical protein